MIKKVLTIAGSDCSGGAGIQADIKTITMHGHYAMSVITSLTAQNTLGISGIQDIPAEFVDKQLEAVFSDIFPDAIKIGMVSNAEIVKVISAKLRKYNPKNIVIDPVMISTSGYSLLDSEAVEYLKEELFPLATIITPNIPETEYLTGMSVTNSDKMKTAAMKLAAELNVSVLVKGGHLEGKALDTLCDKNGEVYCYETRRINSKNSHGTGCTLSSAIASNLASGFSLSQSINKSKIYLYEALSANLNLGSGSGPLNHFYRIAK